MHNHLESLIGYKNVDIFAQTWFNDGYDRRAKEKTSKKWWAWFIAIVSLATITIANLAGIIIAN